eukprot:TRINITY_DN41102_c0_g1_i1.p1 TRINITY_DN41102_c0_g1~~TRINITY_DN41102_c0_g1_i1.p1  ORF type:complete len:266 (+),score=41.81 TRINITY_DN41102_c0_g1_i1:254-1051(+)
MARNEEKANSMLNRYLELKKVQDKGVFERERRPHLASECDVLEKAEYWRRDILREVSKKISEIQNASLGEHKIRDLNDNINKLLREKGHWERRIVELGGADYRKTAPEVLDKDGKTPIGTRKYKYFGAARHLDGVQQMFDEDKPKAPKRTRYEMYQNVDAEYYGFRDDDDGLLEPLEAESEREAIAAAVQAWEEEQATRRASGKEAEMAWADHLDAADSDVEEDMPDGQSIFKSHVPLPSAQEIERVLLERKKKELLAQLASAAQ